MPLKPQKVAAQDVSGETFQLIAVADKSAS